MQQFSSIPELIQLSGSVDLNAVSRGMLEHLEELRKRALAFWTNVLQSLEEGPGTELRLSQTAPTAPLDPATVFGNGGGPGGGPGGLQAVLDCTSEEHGVAASSLEASSRRRPECIVTRHSDSEAWKDFHRAFQGHAAAGFPIDWELQVRELEKQTAPPSIEIAGISSCEGDSWACQLENILKTSTKLKA